MMTGSELAAALPPQATAERDETILRLVREGTHLRHQWAAVRLDAGGTAVEILVSEDALRIGSASDALRVNIRAATAERIAHHLGALLLTPKVADAIHRAAQRRIAPQTQSPGPEMSSTAAMLRHSRSVDVALAATGGSGLAANVGKDWVLTNRLLAAPNRAANYGWHTTSRGGFPAVTAGLSVLQPLGLAHDRQHVDYSQVWRGMSRTCKVDGAERDLSDVLRDPKLAPALSHEGPLRLRLDAERGGDLGAVREIEVVRDPLALVPRTLRRGMSGGDVAAWQRVVGVTEDGQFGPATEAATREFQRRHGLQVDGVVGSITRAAARLVPDGGEMLPFVPARSFGRGRSAKIDVVVLHTMEAPEKPDTAERVAAWFAGPHAPIASAHYCVDEDSIVQCVREGDVAFHAPGVNHRSIGVEHAGYARQSPEDWADAYSLGMLRRSAQLVAGVCHRHGIPVRRLDEAALLRGEAGITTHGAVSRAFKKSSHTDPGPAFPMEEYLTMVLEHLP